MSSTHIFASKSDWELIVNFLQGDYVFYNTDHTQNASTKTLIFNTINTGVCKAKSQVHGDLFIVSNRLTPVVSRKINESRYAWDLMLNQHAVAISLGGKYDDCWIAGTVGYKLKNDQAKAIYLDWSKAIRKTCKKVGAYYLGAECYELLKLNQFRFTTDKGSPVEYDLKM
jgi:hypothetical protein